MADSKAWLARRLAAARQTEPEAAADGKRSGGRRRQHTPAEVLLIVSLYYETGLSQAQFQAQFGIPERTLRSYITRLELEQPAVLAALRDAYQA